MLAHEKFQDKSRSFSTVANISKRVALLLSLCLTAAALPHETIAKPPVVSEFTSDQLFSSGGGGCGMTLWEPQTAEQHRYIFFNGFESSDRFGKLFDRGSMFMMIDGQMTKFSRISGRGENFYGQKLFQTFQSSDLKIRVEVEVTLGKAGEIESVAIAKGVIRIKKVGERAIVIPVIGDAGC
jgi:hypothetical protein